QATPEHLEDRASEGSQEDLFLAPLLDGVELHPPHRASQDRWEVDEARHGFRLAGAGRPAQRGRDDALEVADRVSNRYPASLVDLRRTAQLRGERGQDLLDERRYPHRDLPAARRRPGFLVHDGDLVAP